MDAIKGFLRAVIVFLITLEAKFVLRKYHPQIVLVTGGVGKTLAKGAIYTALADSFFVRRSEKSHGSDLSIPLTILGVSDGRGNVFEWAKNLLEGLFLLVMEAPYPKWLIVEASADRPGDVTKALSWLTPSVVVATRFSEVPSHVEFFSSPEAVIEEELAPVKWILLGGILIVNADDARAESVLAREGVQKITFGFGEANVRASKFHVNSRAKMPSGISFDVTHGDERARVSLPGVAGVQHAYPVLAGISVALRAGVPLEKAANAFESHLSPPGRMHLIDGMRDSVIIDDSYNASPVATEEALAALGDIPRTGRRIAVLADMLELGTFSVDEHYRVGGIAARASDVLITVGVRAHDIARGARDAGMMPDQIFESENSAEAASRLVSLIGPGDVVLIKGSQVTRMERIVKFVMAKPEKAPDLLVRQTKEWLRPR